MFSQFNIEKIAQEFYSKTGIYCFKYWKNLTEEEQYIYFEVAKQYLIELICYSFMSKNTITYECACEVPENVSSQDYELKEYTFVTNVTIYPGHSGYVSGPPEKCFPPEPTDIEWGDFICQETGKVFAPEEYELLVNWGRFLYDGNPYSLRDEEFCLLESWSDANEPDYEDREDFDDYDYNRDVDALDY